MYLPACSDKKILKVGTPSVHMCANLSMVAKGLVLISYSVKHFRQKPIEFTILGL